MEQRECQQTRGDEAVTREVAEWVGKTDDTPCPPRVRLRVFDRDKGICQCGCTIKIQAGDKWETDHLIAIALGGANAENNLRTLLAAHHKLKTRSDVAEKSTNYRVRAKHLGLTTKRQKIQSAGFRKPEPQRTASRPIERRS